MARLGGGNLGLAEQKGEMQTFLAKGGAVGCLLEGGVEERAGLLKAAAFEEFVGATGLGVARAGAARKDDNGQQGKESPEHAG